MGNDTKIFFYVPRNDYAPEKLIRLGQIITDLKRPWERLSEPLLPFPEIHSGKKIGWEHIKKNSTSISLGIFANFLALFGGIGGGISGSHSRKNTLIYKFDKLETVVIQPDDKYVKESVFQQRVKQEIDRGWLTGKSVFMVTGLKIARGASVKRVEGRANAIEPTLTVDLSMLSGVPIQVGPEVAWESESESTESFTGASDYVFAYSVRKIHVHRSGRIEFREVTGGDLHGVGDDDNEEEPPENQVVQPGEIESVELEEEDFGNEYLPVGYRTIDIGTIDGSNEECRVLCPVSF